MYVHYFQSIYQAIVPPSYCYLIGLLVCIIYFTGACSISAYYTKFQSNLVLWGVTSWLMRIIRGEQVFCEVCYSGNLHSELILVWPEMSHKQASVHVRESGRRKWLYHAPEAACTWNRKLCLFKQGSPEHMRSVIEFRHLDLWSTLLVNLGTMSTLSSSLFSLSLSFLGCVFVRAWIPGGNPYSLRAFFD